VPARRFSDEAMIEPPFRWSVGARLLLGAVRFKFECPCIQNKTGFKSKRTAKVIKVIKNEWAGSLDRPGKFALKLFHTRCHQGTFGGGW
jgi:hypothetical protein